MVEIESFRKSWNKQQGELRPLLTKPGRHEEAIRLFFEQHNVLHSARMAPVDWSYEDEILDGLPEEQFRRIPRSGQHSIAWNLWHLARIEDVTMNLLVAGTPQIFNQGNWAGQLKTSARETGNGMSPEEIAALSAGVDFEALRAYRVAVGQRTCQIVRELQPADLKRKVEPARLQQIMDEGAVVEAARGLIDYWGKRDMAGLLLMPPTRHCFIHLNEAYQLKGKRR